MNVVCNYDLFIYGYFIYNCFVVSLHQFEVVNKKSYFSSDPENFMKARTSKIRHMQERDYRMMIKAIKER